MSYTIWPKTIRFSQVMQKQSLSPSNHGKLNLKNKNFKLIEDLLDKKKIKKGKEVGSKAYIKKSTNFFIRTKALQPNSFLPEINTESVIPILPQEFRPMSLTEGRILVSKDSNVGEVVYLNEDFSNHTLSAGIHSLEFLKDKFYVLGFMKSQFFKEQWSLLIPTGATIKHGKEFYLKCKIPFPNKDEKKIIEYVETLVMAIIRRESKIKEKYNLMNNIFRTELKENQKNNKFSFTFPKYTEVMSLSRIDTGIYDKEYKEIIHQLTNYKNGSFKIPKEYFKIGTTPKKRIVGVGDKKWITPTTIHDLGYLITEEKIHCEKQNIKKDCILFINRTSREKLGEFVGITFFYDFKKLGMGQHNQGCYRVDKYDSVKLKLITVLMNTQMYRKICGHMSMGAKMKEMKSEQFASIPFPNLDDDVANNLIRLYDSEQSIGNVLVSKLESFDVQNIDSFGILQLASQIELFRKRIDLVVNRVVRDERIEFDLESAILK